MGLNSCRETWKHQAMIQVDLNNCSPTIHYMDTFIPQGQHLRQILPIMTTTKEYFFLLLFFSFITGIVFGLRKECWQKRLPLQNKVQRIYWSWADVCVLLMNSVFCPPPDDGNENEALPEPPNSQLSWKQGRQLLRQWVTHTYIKPPHKNKEDCHWDSSLHSLTYRPRHIV